MEVNMLEPGGRESLMATYEFYVESMNGNEPVSYTHLNITSKQAQQEIGISLIDDVFSLFRKGSYAALFKQMLSSLPGATSVSYTHLF